MISNWWQSAGVFLPLLLDQHIICDVWRSSQWQLMIFQKWGDTPPKQSPGLSYQHGVLDNWIFALKGLSHQIRFAWKWYGLLGLGKDMWRWTFKFFFFNLFNFEVLMQPTLNTYQFTFSWEVGKCCYKPAYNFHSSLTNYSGCSPRWFRKPKSAAISWYQHWRISPLFLGMR